MEHRLMGNATTRMVWLNDELLDPAPSQKIHNHSPDGFNWGYYGSGPSQLALAVVLKITGSHEDYQEFKNRVIANIPPGKTFDITFEL